MNGKHEGHFNDEEWKSAIFYESILNRCAEIIEDGLHTAEVDNYVAACIKALEIMISKNDVSNPLYIEAIMETLMLLGKADEAIKQLCLYFETGEGGAVLDYIFLNLMHISEVPHAVQVRLWRDIGVATKSGAVAENIIRKLHDLLSDRRVSLDDNELAHVINAAKSIALQRCAPGMAAGGTEAVGGYENTSPRATDDS